MALLLITRHLKWVSIHAPVKGRHAPLRRWRIRLCFNPRPREGATPVGFSVRMTSLVSIHAPVKGRRGVLDRADERASFNPRPREGATKA